MTIVLSRSSITRTIFGAALTFIGATALTAPALAEAPPASAWQIGPIIDGRNYSVNMPLRPQEGRDGASFTIPGPSKAAGHVHYVTLPVRSLEGARKITLRYRIDAPRGTRFIQQENPAAGPATLSLYFQRYGDSWRMRHPDYRWYSPVAREMPLSPGVHTVSIGLDEDWIAMTGPSAHQNRAGFRRAVADAHRVGFTFGGSSGRGHGVYATAPATFTVLDFKID